MNAFKTMSGADFRQTFGELLRTIADNDQVSFGAGDLSVYRVKERGPVDGPRIVQIEFNEVYTVTD